ncbi:hypothetical protein [Thalassotalea ganghwensis]
MESKRPWYEHLSNEEIALADSYYKQIDKLINDLPKNAPEEQQRAAFEKQKFIFEEQLQHLKVISSARKLGITPKEYQDRLAQAKKSSKIFQKLKLIALSLAALFMSWITIKFITSL